MFLTPRSGIRVDVRVHLSNNTVHTFLNANPDVVTHFSQERPPLRSPPQIPARRTR